MVLPVGFERKNEKLYEEVNIPPTDRPPEDFCFEPVYIGTLDEVCSALVLYLVTLNVAYVIVLQLIL